MDAACTTRRLIVPAVILASSLGGSPPRLTTELLAQSRVTVSGDSPLPPAAAAFGGRSPLAEPAAEALDVHLARQIVAEHGGVASLGRDADGGGVIRIELPAV